MINFNSNMSEKEIIESIKKHNKTAKHQQDLLQYEGNVCKCIAAGTHASTPHLLKTVIWEDNV